MFKEHLTGVDTNLLACIINDQHYKIFFNNINISQNMIHFNSKISYVFHTKTQKIELFLF